MTGLSFMMAETPKANNVVCTKQPVIRPATTAKPHFLPLLILCTRTKILSGPGERDNANVAIENANKIS